MLNSNLNTNVQKENTTLSPIIKEGRIVGWNNVEMNFKGSNKVSKFRMYTEVLAISFGALIVTAFGIHFIPQFLGVLSTVKGAFGM